MKIAVMWGEIELYEFLARYDKDCSSQDCICWRDSENKAKKWIREACGATVTLPKTPSKSKE